MLSLDRELLGTLDTVTELYDRKCRVYKMNYPDYVSYGATINAAAIGRAAEGRKHLAADRKTLGIVLDRRNHFTADAEKRARRDEGLTRLNLSAARSQGKATTSRLREIHEKRIKEAEEELKDAKKRIRPENRIEIDIPQVLLPSGKRVFELKEVNAAYNGKLLWKRRVSFQYYYNK